MDNDGIISAVDYESPCGPLLLGATEECLCLCDWTDATHHEKVLGKLQKTTGKKIRKAEVPLTTVACRQLDEYFKGERHTFDIPILTVGTEFQKRIWRELMGVGYGETLSYSELAERAGCPAGVRAVANAVGANPISIFIPCHRIVGISGDLTGYAGGIQAKLRLLNLEKERLLTVG